MRFTIRARPVFYFRITRAQLDALLWLSKHHYDGKCQQASIPGRGGFINGWKNTLDFMDDGECSANLQELDLCLKITELAAHAPMPPGDYAEVVALRKGFSAACRFASKHVGVICFDEEL